jgi:hypothetical protein
LTYSITISGHSDNEDSERTNLENAREFVASLEGVESSNFSGQHVGSVQLHDTDTEEEANDEQEGDE